MHLFHALMPSSAVAPAPPRHLVDAAHEFEAQMMKELLEPMATVAAVENGDDAAEAGSGNTLAEFSSEALGRALSEHGGLGIADLIIQNLSSNGLRAQSGRITTTLQAGISLGEAE